MAVSRYVPDEQHWPVAVRGDDRVQIPREPLDRIIVVRGPGRTPVARKSQTTSLARSEIARFK